MMLKDEMCVLKTMIVSIDDENALLVSMQYHSECDGHIDSSLSESCRRWFAVAAKKSQFKAWSKELWEAGDERAKMPLDKSKWFVCFGSQNAASCLSDHLDVKLKKMLSWEDGMKKLSGWEKKTSRHPARMNPRAAWEDSGYIAPDGEEVCLRDRDSLLKHLMQPLVKDVEMKKAAAAAKRKLDAQQSR